MQALITGIQKFCVHDGPGIRTTVFFKGCPMSCTWCHNPETQNFNKEMMINSEKCTRCGRCADRCPSNSASMTAGILTAGPGSCSHCETCLDFCTAGAREIAGEEWDCERLLQEIEKDRAFYETSGGGVTLSGGEVLSQPDAAVYLAERCHRKGIHVTVDTCGFAPYEVFERIAPFTDLFLFDIKIMNPRLHMDETGVDNRMILMNLKRLSQSAAVHLRLPLVAGVNADDSHVDAVLEFIKPLRIQQVSLLPYHDTGSFKYQRLGRTGSGVRFRAPQESWLESAKDRFERAGYMTKIGG